MFLPPKVSHCRTTITSDITMRKAIYIIGIALLMAACSHIAEDEQLIEVAVDDMPTNEIMRNVLLEDFTGQRCVNCPKAAEIIHQLEKAYGDRFIPVGIYWEPKPVPNGLATETGKEYFSNWNVEAQPAGLVGRHGAISYIPNDWIGLVRDEIQRTADIEMLAEATLNDKQIDITITETSQQNAVSGKLQVWIIEDGIVATQLMPDGSANKDYVHNHVFRTAVNGTWGDAITIGAGTTLTQTFHQAIDSQWDTTKLSVVAFVYNDKGVEQAIKVNIK